MKNSTQFSKLLFLPLVLICCLASSQLFAQIVVGTNGPNQTISTSFTGNQSLTKIGGNDVRLTGNNTYTGGTFLTSGALTFDSSNNLGTGDISIAAANTSLNMASASVTLGNNIVFSNFNGIFIINAPNNSSLVLNGTISGGGPDVLWNFSGGGGGQNTSVLTLNGTNTFAGALEVWRGPIILGNSQAAGSARIILDSNLNPSGSLQFSSSFAISNSIQTKTASEPIGVAGGRSNGLTGVISGTGGINKVDSGMLYYLANNTYTGTTTISAGSLVIGNGGTLGSLGSGNVINNAALTLNRSDSFSVGNTISGAGSLTKLGAGTTTLGGANTYKGDTTISNGVLKAGGNGVMSADSIVRVRAGSFDLNGTTNVVRGLALYNATNVQSGGSLTMRHTTGVPEDGLVPGALQIGVNSTDVAKFVLNSGLVTIQSQLQVGLNGNGTFEQTGGTNSVEGGYWFVLGRFAGSVGTYDLSGGLARQATENFSIIGENGTGLFRARGDGVFSNAAAVRIGLGATGLGTLSLAENAQFIAPGIIFGNSSSNQVIFNLAYNTNYAGAISGGGSLVKDGAATVTLSADNSYTGTTTIANGTLVVEGVHANWGGDDIGDYIVNTPGVLAGTGYLAAEVTGNGTISPGSPGQVGELTIGELLTFAGLLNIRLDGDDISQLTVSQDVNIDNVSVNFDAFGTQGEETYIFLATCSDFSGLAFSNVTGVPVGYSVKVEAEEGVAFLQTNSASASVTAFTTNGVTAVIGSSGFLPFQVLVYNGLTNNLTNIFSTNNGSTVTGSFASATPLSTNDAEVFSGLTFTNGTPGSTNTATFDVVTGVVTNPTTFDVLVYDHASNSVSGTNLTFAPVHRNAGLVTSSNSITVSNASDGVIRADMGVTNLHTNTDFINIDTRTGLAQGESAKIFGELNTTNAPLGRVTNNAQLIAYDDMDLSGASTNVGTTGIQLVSYVYSGQGEWNTLGGGNWTNINQWEEKGGTPGVDGVLSFRDTALFGTNGNGTVTNNGNVQLSSITFSNSDSYTIGGNGSIAVASISTEEGSHTISNRITNVFGLTISNATGTLLTLSMPVSGPFGLTKQGDGTTTLAGVNTYEGGTFVDGGQLNVTSSFGLANNSNNFVAVSNAVVSFDNSDVFGRHNQPIEAGIYITDGGKLQSGGAYYNALGYVYLKEGTIEATSTESAGYSFAFTDEVFVDGPGISTIAGPGIALGSGRSDTAYFNVQSNATLEATGNLVDGPSAADYNQSKPSSLVKTGEGTMVVSGSNTYTGLTFIQEGTLVTASSNAVGKGSVFIDAAGTLAPAVPSDSLIIDGNLVVNKGTYLWTLTNNTVDGPGTNFTAPINLKGDLLVEEDSPFNLFFDTPVLSTDLFWAANTRRTWTVLSNTGKNPVDGFSFKIGWAAGSQTNGFDLNDFFFTLEESTGLLNLNWLKISSNLIATTAGTTVSSSTNYAAVEYEPTGLLTVSSGAELIITDPVVMSNNSTTTINGSFVAPGGITVNSGSTLGGSGTIDAEIVNSGLLAPAVSSNSLTINNDLTFTDSGAFVWTLFNNTTNNTGGTNFTAPVALNANLAVSTNSKFQVLLTNNVSATDSFWVAETTNSWTVMAGGDFGNVEAGRNFQIEWAPGSYTNGFKLRNFYLTTADNNLVLNWMPGLIVFPGADVFDPGVNEFPWIQYQPNGELEIQSNENVVIATPVVMSNDSRTIVNGQFTAPSFTVMSGSMVGGTGLIAGNLVNNGLVSPGNSPGTLSIGGNFTQTGSGSFLLEAGSLSVFDRLNVTGAAALAGNLTATGIAGHTLSVGDRYQFLTADGGISGTFDTITMPAGLRGSFLISGVNNSLGTLLIAPSTYTSMATTPNQFNVAQALDSFIGAGGDRGTVSAALDTLTAAQYPAAFEQTLPNAYASLPNMAFNTANALNSGMFQRLWVIRVNGKGFSASGMNVAPMQAEMGGTDDMGAFAINPSKDTKWGTFVDGNGIFANGGDVSYLQNYRSQSGGVSTGASYKWNDNLATGVYVGYQGLQAEYDNGRTIDNAVRFGVFGTYDIDDFYFNALVGGAYHGYTVNRNINFGGLNRTATGRPGAGEFDLALGTGYDFQAGDFTWGPFTTMQYTYIGVQGFTETGAGALNLDVDPYNSSSLLYTLGAQAAYNWKLSKDVIVTPTIFAGWQHEFLQDSYQINSSFNTGGPAAPFNYNTGTPARDNFYGGVGVTVGVGDRWQATATYSSFVGGQSQSSQNLYLGLGYKF
jgi:autotransporter-associated beta strand protein